MALVGKAPRRGKIASVPVPWGDLFEMSQLRASRSKRVSHSWDAERLSQLQVFDGFGEKAQDKFVIVAGVGASIGAKQSTETWPTFHPKRVAH
jgi:hypothetical protein